MDNIKTIIETNSKLHDLMMSKWLAQDLFSVKWWGVLGFIIISYIICFCLMDKTRLTKIILFGSLVSVFSVVIDITGSSFNLWAYSMYLFPIKPSIFFYDITVLPLYFMLAGYNISCVIHYQVAISAIQVALITNKQFHIM